MENKNVRTDNQIISAGKVYPADKYLLDSYMLPIWSSAIIYNESVMFIGKEQEVPLLFKPDKIISVRSHNLRTKYELNKDYIVNDGKLKLTENTSIPYFELDEYYLTSYVQNECFPRVGGGYVVAGESDKIIRRQVVVTYRRSVLWDEVIPESQSHKIRKTIKKLKNKEPVTILFYGDSITVGGNCSGLVGVEPHMPVWPRLIVEKLRDLYGYDEINYVNTAVGGTTSSWGAQNAEENVADYNPDLAVIAFGMNDINIDPEIHKENILSIIDTVSERSPNTEYVLVSTMLPNEEARDYYGNQYMFEEEYEDIEKNRSDVALARMTSMHECLLKYKRYSDMTGNNINHCNDFLARVYAQTVLTAMVGRYELGV